jgi:hypothetical protein
MRALVGPFGLVPLLAGTDTGSGTGEPVRDAFRAAFAAAVKEHGTPAEPATPDDEETEAEPPAREREADEPEETPDEGEPTEAARGDGDLLTTTEFTALQQQHGADTPALKKALEAAWTRKTQALAEKRRSVERLQAYQPLIDDLETDPASAITRLAEQYGVELVSPAPEPGDPADPHLGDAIAHLVGELTADIKADLGPDLDYLADPLSTAFAKALTKGVQRLTRGTIEQAVRPVMQRDAQIQTQTVMTAFADKHPDWQQYERPMLALAQQIHPNGMSELDFLEHLYRSVSFEDRVEREVSGRFKKRFSRMNEGQSEVPIHATPEGQVRKRPDGPVDFRQAFRDAKAGIRYED